MTFFDAGSPADYADFHNDGCAGDDSDLVTLSTVVVDEDAFPLFSASLATSDDEALVRLGTMVDEVEVSRDRAERLYDEASRMPGFVAGSLVIR